MTTKTKKTLSATQLHALDMVSQSKKGFLWVGDGIGLGKDRHSRAVAKVTAKSLEKLGFVKFHSASGHRTFGIGCWACYQVTPAGREIILVGRMLAKAAFVR